MTPKPVRYSDAEVEEDIRRNRFNSNEMAVKIYNYALEVRKAREQIGRVEKVLMDHCKKEG